MITGRDVFGSAFQALHAHADADGILGSDAHDPGCCTDAVFHRLHAPCFSERAARPFIDHVKLAVVGEKFEYLGHTAIVAQGPSRSNAEQHIVSGD